MRMKSSFMFAIAACNRFWFCSSVPASISALRSLLSLTCRERSSRFGLLFGGGPAPGGGPVGVLWARVVLVRHSEKRPATTNHNGLLGFSIPQLMRIPPASNKWAHGGFCLKGHLVNAEEPRAVTSLENST